MAKIARMANLYVPDVDKSAATSDIRPRYESQPGVGGRIERLLARVVILEFSMIAVTCFLASTFYFYTVLTVAPPTSEYVSAALLIALLITFLSFGLKQYNGIQAQPRDRF